MMKFVLNQELIETDLPSGMILADFIRYQQCLTGTKLGCREGDCGACTVLIGTLKNDKVIYESVTSCLMPLGNVEGRHIVTIEGVNIEGLNVVQQAMADEGGTQCGFCTPGFIMSLCGLALSEGKITKDQAILAIAGNICRCTGYKSIERAAEYVVQQLVAKNHKDKLGWLVEHRFLPNYFLEIAKKLKDSSPITKPDAIPASAIWVGGGTDLYVQRPQKMFSEDIVHAYNRNDLKGIWKASGYCHIGASTATEALKQSEIIQSLSPNTDHFFNLISSLQIRNMATIAGNLVNASPIGDLAVFLLALNANIVLNANGALRELPLEQFFKGYKTLDLKADEFVQEVNFELPRSTHYFNFEKVCKRTYLDIASVNSAIRIECNTRGEVIKAGISAGGVAPVPKYLAKTAQFFIGKTISKSVLDESLEIAQKEISPIADVRGSVAYKRLLLRQLMIAHYRSFFPTLFD
ncbi:FAD binding domain-containing protein [Aureispira anguillae]|uniref:FAD binding domain-containing protein n=1 Tax=Aureispira anguillae TaxID=2864201 RepID=A0A915YEU2_9BACT|nr:FAD binding domain-containing protein [Aureispira anguillae]BDS11828.1 FAD binding domain-containing protein [Aureispira anguillae]